MADSEGRFLGNDELLYIKTGTAPTTPLADTEYTEFGLVVNNPFAGQAEVIRAADKGASRFSGAVPGTASYNIQAEGHRKNVADAGHEIVRDAWLNGTKVWWLISTGVTGEEAKYGGGYVTAYGETSGTNEHVRITATIEGDGAPTFGPVPA
jgi:hypothetical protein